MSKLTLKIDISDDYDKALQEFEKIYKQELDKNKESIKLDSFLSNLYKLVNSQLNTNYSNTNSLIQALTPYATSAFKEKLTTSTIGRRKTISMNKEIYLSILSLLNTTSPNKAAIAREVGASVVQVRKVASGGYDKKYGRVPSSSRPEAKTTLNDDTSSITLTQNPLPTVPVAPPKNKELSHSTNSKITRPPMRFPAKSPLDL